MLLIIVSYDSALSTRTLSGHLLDKMRTAKCSRKVFSEFLELQGREWCFFTYYPFQYFEFRLLVGL